MYCPHCGKENESNTINCAYCGVALASTPANISQDKPNTLINIISLCCIPILGIVMYFVWKDSQPQAAKSALIFGLVGIGLVVVFYIIFFVMGLFVTYKTPV